MRRLSVLAAMVLAVTIGVAAEPTETITVTANATVYVKPDAARVHYLVRVNEPSIEEAKDSASKMLKTMDESLKKLGLSDLTTNAGVISYSRVGATGRARPGGFGAAGAPGAASAAARAVYSAQCPLTATIREKDLDKLRASVDTFLKKIVESGAIIAGDGADADSPFSSAAATRLLIGDSPRIDWVVTDESTARRDAYRSAIRKAKADAETLSKEIGWDNFKVISVTDGASATATRDPFESASAALRSATGSGGSPGAIAEVAISVRVTLKCSR